MKLLYPHEWLFGGFMLVTYARLVAAGYSFGADALVFGTALLIAAGLVVLDRRIGSVGSNRWRLLFYPIAMNVLFQQMRTAIPVLTPVREDQLLRGIDAWLIGETPAILLQPWITPVVTEILSFCYLLFFPYLLVSVIYYFIGPIQRCRAFVCGLFSLYGLGFLGYTLVPAAGPYLAFPAEFNQPLSGWALTRWNSELVGLGSTGVDVFPSLHVAVSSFLLGFDFRHKPTRFHAYLLPCVGLWLSTLYLRYHYLIDVLCGFLLAGLALWIAHCTQVTENRA